MILLFYMFFLIPNDTVGKHKASEHVVSERYRRNRCGTAGVESSLQHGPFAYRSRPGDGRRRDATAEVAAESKNSSLKTQSDLCRSREDVADHVSGDVG